MMSPVGSTCTADARPDALTAADVRSYLQIRRPSPPASFTTVRLVMAGSSCGPLVGEFVCPAAMTSPAVSTTTAKAAFTPRTPPPRMTLRHFSAPLALASLSTIQSGPSSPPPAEGKVSEHGRCEQGRDDDNPNETPVRVPHG